MIAYISGTVTELHPTTVVVEAAGVGYELNISVYAHNALQGQGQAKLLVHEILREDTHELYGFLEEAERQMFRLLISVSGIGANTARIMLSSYAPEELAGHIIAENDAALRGVKGIGSKTAQRVIIDLKDKVKTLQLEGQLAGSTALPVLSPESQAEWEEASIAFMHLGYPRAAVKKVVAKLFKNYPELSLNQKIKKGLTLF